MVKALKLGTQIYQKVARSYPMSFSGRPILPKFSNMNPAFLEALPDEFCTSNFIKELEKFNGTAIEEVEKVLNSMIFKEKAFNPNTYLAKLYREIAPRKNKPEIWLDFAKRAENGLLTKQETLENILKVEYDKLRLANYDMKYFNSNIEKITEQSTSKINVICENGWHYRTSTDSSLFKAQYRISVNANADENVIRTLDDFVSPNRYYKTPDSAVNWLERHDPITIYFKEKPTENEIQELVNKLKKCNAIRNTDDVLAGEKIIPGVVLQKNPTRQETKELINKCTKVSEDFGKAVEVYLKQPNGEIKSSAGQYYVIEALLNKIIH